MEVKDILEKIRKGDFYEYDVHHGNYYGTSRELMNEKQEYIQQQMRNKKMQ